ncbi:unnamed protein product [Parascedosporium putredinis]|uniref:Uncharacterized protein n=1 Tax=Parascedosporium putredinis TaxID=1442378 RepID=A0A9P1MBC3_9PEZI|nr:unnamed protein product [Parascedosporium putredinis]CAI7999320.1 unnamed protein product [Parascedosporium putredinis]
MTETETKPVAQSCADPTHHERPGRGVVLFGMDACSGRGQQEKELGVRCRAAASGPWLPGAADGFESILSPCYLVQRHQTTRNRNTNADMSIELHVMTCLSCGEDILLARQRGRVMDSDDEGEVGEHEVVVVVSGLVFCDECVKGDSECEWDAAGGGTTRVHDYWGKRHRVGAGDTGDGDGYLDVGRVGELAGCVEAR